MTRKYVDDTWYERPEDCPPERLTAGGVVVRVENGQVLAALIRERGIEGYVLPKGGVEPGEDIEAASRREIEEEAGLSELTHLSHLDVLERMDSEKRWWSIIHYGLYLTTQIEGVIGDTLNHSDLGWFTLDALPPMFWPDERDLIERNRTVIAAMARQAGPRK